MHDRNITRSPTDNLSDILVSSKLQQVEFSPDSKLFPYLAEKRCINTPTASS